MKTIMIYGICLDDIDTDSKGIYENLRRKMEESEFGLSSLFKQYKKSATGIFSKNKTEEDLFRDFADGYGSDWTDNSGLYRTIAALINEQLFDEIPVFEQVGSVLGVKAMLPANEAERLLIPTQEQVRTIISEYLKTEMPHEVRWYLESDD